MFYYFIHLMLNILLNFLISLRTPLLRLVCECGNWRKLFFFRFYVSLSIILEMNYFSIESSSFYDNEIQVLGEGKFVLSLESNFHQVLSFALGLLLLLKSMSTNFASQPSYRDKYDRTSDTTFWIVCCKL